MKCPSLWLYVSLVSLGGPFDKNPVASGRGRYLCFCDETWPVGMAVDDSDDAGCWCKGVSHFPPSTVRDRRTRGRATGVGQQQPFILFYFILFYSIFLFTSGQTPVRLRFFRLRFFRLKRSRPEASIYTANSQLATKWITDRGENWHAIKLRGKLWERWGTKEGGGGRTKKKRRRRL